jgi:hypothetical protein
VVQRGRIAHFTREEERGDGGAEGELGIDGHGGDGVGALCDKAYELCATKLAVSSRERPRHRD